MQDGTGLVEQIQVAGVNVVEVWHEDLHELGVQDESVEGWEVPVLGKLLIQTPKSKDLHDIQRCGHNRIGKRHLRED